MLRAVFLDKDGTIVKDVPYNVNPDLITFEPDVPEALSRLQRSGYALVVVTNQSGVARGYFDEKDLILMLDNLRDKLWKMGVGLNAIYFCPHHPCGIVDKYRKRCECRKPDPGLLIRAAHDHGIDLSTSWMIGDILNDVEAGNRAGCRSILIDNGNETEWLSGEFRAPDYKVNSLARAADIILAADKINEHEHNANNNNSALPEQEGPRYR